MVWESCLRASPHPAIILKMIHKRITDRIRWFKELWEYILAEMHGDVELAKPVYKTILFEENYKK